MKRNSKGRFVKGGTARLTNPRRRRKHRRAKARRANPRRHRRHVARRRANPRHRRYHRARRRSNPRFSMPSLGGIQNQLMMAGVGGLGAIVNSVLLGYVAGATGPLTGIAPFLTSGYGLHALRIGSSLGLGILGKKFGGKYGQAAGEGALTVAMYLLLRDVVVAFAPTLPLGDYEEISIDSTSDQIGAYMGGGYMDPAANLGAARRLPDGSRAPMGAYMGAYTGRDEMVGQSYSYEGEMDGLVLSGMDMSGMDY